MAGSQGGVENLYHFPKEHALLKKINQDAFYL